MKHNQTSQQGPLISQSTILILSGYLVGMVSTQMAHTAYGHTLFLVGVFGIVSYLGLKYVSDRREQQAEETAHNRAVSELESRVNRHVRHCLSARRRRPFEHRVVNDQQYLPVVRSSQASYR